ncbi:hypothetical protein ACFW6N_34885 [Streptomyces cyaneofuscatus]|uniref:hypothetical protein n=1 Tax=Streptomyces cyaneofuscatus TaxID=66883 RepID=UPI003682798B
MVQLRRKYRVAHTTDAIIGAVSRSLTDPATALLGRYDRAGSLRYTGRRAVLSRPLATALRAQLSPAGEGHPWTGRTFSASRGSKAALTVALVVPELVAEVRADVSRDSAGRWRHPVKLVRLRDDLAPPTSHSSATPPKWTETPNQETLRFAGCRHRS